MKKVRFKTQQGFSLVTAIFLLVVLGALGAMMVTFFGAQQQSSALDALGARAYQAARAGVEWAALGVSQTPQGTLWPGCSAGTTLSASTGNPLGGLLAAYTVVVTCTTQASIEGDSTVYVYNVTSTATGVDGAAPGGRDYVERVVNVKMGR